MAKWAANHNGRSFRYGRGKNKFWQSWDAEKMAERERARRLNRETKDARRKFKGGEA